MKKEHAERVTMAAERYQDLSSELILAIDAVEVDSERRELRRAFAEMIAFIEKKFVYEVKQSAEKKN